MIPTGSLRPSGGTKSQGTSVGSGNGGNGLALRSTRWAHCAYGRQMRRHLQIDKSDYAMGYSGSGNSMAPYLGHKAALQILGNPEGETVFTRSGFPTHWWHRGPPWFLPFADLLFRVKDATSNVRRGWR